MSKSVRLLAAAVSCSVVGCDAAPDDGERARGLVVAFERALHAGDRLALCDLVTFESRPAVDALTARSMAGKHPLRLLDTVERLDGLHVRVLDPNHGDRPGAFVVVRENGSLRIDLVATAGLDAQERALPGPATRTVVRPFSPAERARAASLAEQAARPPS